MKSEKNIHRLVVGALRHVLVAAGVLLPVLHGQTVALVPTVVKAAGTGADSYSGDFGSAAYLPLHSPSSVAFDSSGNYYIADTANNCVRRVDASTGAVTTVAGLVSSGGDTCNTSTNASPAAAQGLMQPLGLATDAQDNLYVADSGHNCVRMLPHAQTGISTMTTVAGTCTAPNASTAVTTAGSATPRPGAIALDSSGNLFIAINDAPESIYQVLEHVSGATATSICRVVGATATNAPTVCTGYSSLPTLSAPSGLAFDPVGRLFIADTGNNCVRTQSAGVTTTALGTCTNDNTTSGSASISAPDGLVFSNQGELYFTSTSLNQLFRANLGSLAVTRIAGNPSGIAGIWDQSQDGIGSQSVPLSAPTGLAKSTSGDIMLADTGNHIIRKLSLFSSFGSQYMGGSSSTQLINFSISAGTSVNLSASIGPDFTINSNACSGALTGNAAGSLSAYCTISVSFTPTLPGARNTYLKLADAVSSTSSMMGLQGTGLGAAGVWIAGQADTASTIASTVRGQVSNSAGVLYLLASDGTASGSMIYRVPAGGGTPVVAIAAGSGGMVNPTAIAMDAAENLYVVDSSTGKVIRFDSNGTIETDYATGFTSPVAISVDGDGSVYVAEDGTKHDVVKVWVGGERAVIAGAGSNTSANNVSATTAQFVVPSALYATTDGTLYVSDSGAHRVFAIDTSNEIHFLAGNGSTSSTDATTALGLALLAPAGLSLDAAGDVYIADSTANKVYVIYASTLQTKNVATLLGTGTAGYTGDGADATAATVKTPLAATAVSDGTVYVLDSGNSALRKVTFPVPTLDFGTVGTGGLSAKAKTIWNRGNVAMVRSADPSLTNPTTFQNYSALTTCGLSIDIGAVCDFGFAFNAAASGFQTGSASLNDSAYNMPQVINFKGTTGTPTITSFTAPDETEIYGQTYTGIVNIVTNNGPTPTGTVSFSVNGVVICSVSSNSLIGTVSCIRNPSSGLQQGTYTVSVDYSGDSNYTSEHTTATLTVTKGQITVTIDAKSKLYGAANPALTGTVSGVASGDNVTIAYSTTGTTTSVPGAYPITATATFAPTTLSNSYDVTIKGANLTVYVSPSMTLASSRNPSAPQESVTLTATLSDATSPGTITFLDGANVICSNMAVASGVATCSTTSLGLGSHTIHANYTPSNTYYNATSASMEQYVAYPTGSFTVAMGPDAQYIIGPGSLTYTVTVTSQGGFDGTVKLTCSGLPADAKCELADPTIVLTAGQTVTTTLKTTTTDADAMTVIPGMRWQHGVEQGITAAPVYAATMLPMGLSGLGALFAGIRRSKSLARLFLVIFMTLGMVLISGCGCPTSGLKNYPLTVTGSSVYGGAPDAVATVQMTVAISGR